MQARFSLLGFDETQIHSAVRGAGELVAGIDAERLMEFSRRVIPTHVLPRVFAEARARVAWHRDRGDLVFLVSSSPYEFVEALGEHLGVNGVAATEAELQDGRYTGRILRLCHGAGKAESIRDLARIHDVDLAASYAYGDSDASDLAMLETVGHPVCVNPDRALAARARRTGWPVLRFRTPLALPSVARRIPPRRRARARIADSGVDPASRPLREL